MTSKDLMNEVQKKYKVGDTIILKTWDNESKLKSKIKAIIIEFYSSYVLVEVNGIKECYKYWDILNMTEDPKKSESMGRHSRGSYKYKVT